MPASAPALAPLLPIPSDPEAAIRHLVRVIGLGFNPDTSGSEYVGGDGLPSFDEVESSEIDEAVVQAFAALGERVYQIGMDEMEATK